MKANRFRFRAWDKRRKKMISPNGGDLIAWHGPSNFWDVYILMQSTGLLDAEGVEVFEGDVVRFTRHKWRSHGHPKDGTDLIDVGAIFWSEEKRAWRFSVVWPDGGGYSGACVFTDDRAQRCSYEVIGNIHENPELLEA